MNRLEIDRYDFTTCPFNPNHRFTVEKYKYHLVSCKERCLPHVLANLKQCPHNKAHIFTNPFNLEYHIPRCQDFSGRERYKIGAFGEAPEEIKYQACIYNTLHGIKLGEEQAYKSHLESCPQKSKGFASNALPSPSIDMTVRGQMNYTHGLISVEDMTRPSPVVESTYRPSRQVLIHYCYKSFGVYKEDVGEGFQDNDIWISQLTVPNIREWPGLKNIEDYRLHHKYLVALLHTDTRTPGSICDEFVKLISNNNKFTCCVGVSYQNTSNKDLIIFISHKSEDSGFGSAITNAEIGIFCIPHSSLCQRPSVIGQLQEIAKVKEGENEKISNELYELRNKYENVVAESNQMKFDLEEAKASVKKVREEYDLKAARIEKEMIDTRNSAFTIVNDMKSSIAVTKGRMEAEIMKREHELNMETMNYKSELQNLKFSWNGKLESADRAIAKVRTECAEEIDKQKAMTEKIVKQVKEKDKTILELKKALQEIELRMNEQNSAYLSSDIKDIINKNVMAEKEKYLGEMQDRELCIICCTEKKNIVFIPCGHLAYCTLCLNALGIHPGKKIPKSHSHSRCSVCEKIIEKAHRAFPY